MDTTIVRYGPTGEQGRTGGGKLPLRYWDDLGVVLPPDRLIRRLLGTSSLVVLYGEPGCGKTFLALDMALHIALCRKWFGRDVTPGAVLYVAAEGFAGLNNRIAGFKARHIPSGEVPLVAIDVAIDLGPSGRDADRVIAAAPEVEARTGQPLQLVVVDTLARSMGGGDENSTQDMGAFIAACDRIRTSTGATVLIVHHRGKSSTAGARGSSALLGAADTVIEVERHDGGRVAKIVKQKDGADGQELGFDLDPIEIGRDDEGEPVTTCTVVQMEEAAKAKPRLSKGDKRALEVLTNTLISRPEQRTNSETIPNVSLTSVAAWREALKVAGVTSRDNPDSERTQWSRIKKTLDEKGLIRMHGDLVWKVET